MSQVMRNALLAAILLVPLPVRGDDPCALPAPAQIGARMNELWHAERFKELETYVSDLNGRYPGYLPAEVARSFVDYIFRGELPRAAAALTAVLKQVGGRSEHEEFAARVQAQRDSLNRIRAELEAQGEAFPVQSSPAVMKDMFDTVFPPTLVPNLPPPGLDLVAVTPGEFIGETGAAPSVSIVAPVDAGAVRAGQDLIVAVSVRSAAVPVCKVELTRDGDVIGVDDAVPYTMTWPAVRAGTYALRATATDVRNRTGTSPVVHMTVQ